MLDIDSSMPFLNMGSRFALSPLHDLTEQLYRMVLPYIPCGIRKGELPAGV